MTGWLIAIIIIAILAFLLYCSLTVYVEYKNDDFNLIISYMGIKILDVFGDDEEENDDKDKEKVSKSKKSVKEPNKLSTIQKLKKQIKDILNGQDEEKPKKAPPQNDVTQKEQTQQQPQTQTQQQKEQEAQPIQEQEKSKKTRKKNKTDDFSDTVHSVLEVVKIAFPYVKNVLKKIRITSVKINMQIGTQDASQTAISYAWYCTGIANTIAVLKSQIKVKIKQINIIPNYIIEENVSDISFKVKLRVYVIIVEFLGIMIQIIKNKIK